MTDAELDRLTERAMNGDLSEAEYDRLTAEAIENGTALLGDPERLATVIEAGVFVSAPTLGERLFSAFCTRRNDRYVGQFDSKEDVAAMKRWAIAHLAGYKGARVRTLKNFMPTLGYVVYELTIFVIA